MTMTLREKLQDKKTGFAVAISFLVLAVALSAFYLWPSAQRTNYRKAFFSDDDGQSYFTGSVYDIPPFDHGGNTAYSAIVFNDGNQNFVAYLERFKPDARKRLQDVLDANPDEQYKVIAQMGVVINAGGMEIKAPGSGNNWVPSYQLSKLKLKSPSGSTDCTQVAP